MKNYGTIGEIKLTQISDFKIGNEIYGFFVCNEKQLKLTKNGDHYLEVYLSDNTGKIIGRLWINPLQFFDKFNSGAAVAVKGIVTEFKEVLHIDLTLINEANSEIYAKYGFNPDNLIKTISLNPKKLLDKTEHLLKSVNNPSLQKLNKIILKKYGDEFASLPASVNLYYCEKGGLLQHIFNCINMGLHLSNIYSDLDMDILITGLFIHDIGKIKCFSGDYIFEQTEESKFNNHSELGWGIIVKEINQIKKFPEELKFKLKHELA